MFKWLTKKVIQRDPPWTIARMGFGTAWFDYSRNEYVAMPVPVNYIAAALRSMWLHIKYPVWLVKHQQLIEERQDALGRLAEACKEIHRLQIELEMK